MKLFVYEGSPKEIAEISLLMSSAPQKSTLNSPSEAPTEAQSEPNEGLTVAQVKNVLERRALAEPVVKMLKLLHEAGEERLSSDDLKKELGYNAHEFRGMLGAFGRRLKNTSGIPDGVKLFDEHWDEGLRQKTWSLPKNVRKAVEELGII